MKYKWVETISKIKEKKNNTRFRAFILLVSLLLFFASDTNKAFFFHSFLEYSWHKIRSYRVWINCVRVNCNFELYFREKIIIKKIGTKHLGSFGASKWGKCAHQSIAMFCLLCIFNFFTYFEVRIKILRDIYIKLNHLLLPNI